MTHKKKFKSNENFWTNLIFAMFLKKFKDFIKNKICANII